MACLDAPEPVTVPPSLLRADGRSVYRRHGGVRFATHAQLSMEQRMLALARDGAAPRLDRAEAARALGADLAQLEAALAGGAADVQGARTRTGLRMDQAAAALSVLTDGRRVSVINAPAGSGKTWVLAAAGRAWAAAGLGRVVGITPSQSARNTLAAGVPDWAVRALGPVPQDPPDRLDWQRRAASIGAWRELSGHRDPADPIGPEPVAAAPDLRAAWHEALTALAPAGGPDVRGMPDGRLLHLRDTYPIETAWAPQYVGDELRQVRAAAREARLAGLRVGAQAAAAVSRGDHDTAIGQQELAGSYHILHEAYRQRETVFATIMADRADWDAATRAQRHLAVAADAELRRRHPGQHLSPLRSAEPEPATESQQAELTLTTGQPPGEMGQWITDLTAAHRTFAERLADRQSLTIPSEDPRYGDLGQAFPPWPRPARDAILQPPKPEIRPSLQVLERAADHDADWEAAE